MPLPRTLLRTRLPLPAAALLAGLAGLPPAPARAADGFTEVGSPFPDLPAPEADPEAAFAPGDQAATPAGERGDAEDQDAEDWAEWWQNLRAWSPFAAPPGLPAGPVSRLGGAAASSSAGQDSGFPTSWAGDFVTLPSGPAITTITTTGTTPTTTTTTTTDTPTTTGTGTGSGAGSGDPPAPGTPRLIGEPASMALLGGALAALGLLRRRRPR